MNKYIIDYKRKVNIKKTILNIIELCFFKFFNTFFLKNKVLFISFNGKEYSDNPRAISECLHKLNPSLKLVWLFNNPKKIKCPSYVHIKKNNKFNFYYQLATSRVWVDNNRLVYLKQLMFFGKNKKQLYIQTWHGDRGIKRCFYMVDGYKRFTPFTLEIDGICDYIITGSTFAESAVRKMFNYNGNLLKVGSPKNDCLFKNNDSIVMAIKRRLNIDSNIRILTYAPTFKDYNLDPSEKIEHIDFPRLVKTLEEKTKNKWIVVYRFHHRVSSSSETIANAINGNLNFQDMSELLQITDLLITDYSSCSCDFTLSGKPVILYINDFDKYSKNDRGILFDLKSSPFLVAYNNDELNSIISNFNFTKSSEYCSKINSYFGCYEAGNASMKVSEIILKKINNI